MRRSGPVGQAGARLRQPGPADGRTEEEMGGDQEGVVAVNGRANTATTRSGAKKVVTDSAKPSKIAVTRRQKKLLKRGIGERREFGISFCRRWICCKLLFESRAEMRAAKSKKKLQPKLYNSRISCAGDCPECGAAISAVHSWNKACVGWEQVHVIGEIEQLGPELYVPSLTDPGVLDDGKVDVDDARTAHIGERAPDIAESVFRRVDELRGIKPPFPA